MTHAEQSTTNSLQKLQEIQQVLAAKRLRPTQESEIKTTTDEGREHDSIHPVAAIEFMCTIAVGIGVIAVIFRMLSLFTYSDDYRYV